MRAAVLRGYGQPLAIEDVPDPEPAAGEVLVDVAACGVCGSDHFLQEGGFDSTLPIVPGHEAAGTVAAVGDGVHGVAVGDRVALYYIRHCGSCPMCVAGRVNLCAEVERMGVEFNGAFAERVVVPAVNAVPVPDGLGLDSAAVLTDAVGTPYHALHGVAGVAAGETVVVLGVGGIGSNAVQLAALAGCRVIAVSRSAAKLELARSLGAAHVLAADEDVVGGVADLTDGDGPDVVVQSVGSAAVDAQALELAGRGSRVVLVGASSDSFAMRSVDFIWRELVVMGSRGFTPDDVRAVLALAVAGDIRVDHLTAHARPLAEVNDALADLDDPSVLRTVLHP